MTTATLTLPKPIKIAVGCFKGGVGKTTTACNLAHHLAGVRGYKVLLIDGNPSPDAVRDVTTMKQQGEDLGIQCQSASGPGEYAQALLQAQDVDFVVVDTSQFLDHTTTGEALQDADVIVLVVTPNIVDVSKFEHTAQSFARLRKAESRVVIVPNFMDPMKNSSLAAVYVDYVNELSAMDGFYLCHDLAAQWPDENKSAKKLPTHFFLSQTAEQYGVSPKLVSKISQMVQGIESHVAQLYPALLHVHRDKYSNASKKPAAKPN